MLKVVPIVLILVSLAVPQQTPVFRGGVEVVTVDVVVLDKDGRPVPGLLPADFVVTAGKRVRRILSADYLAVPATAAVDPVAAQLLLVPGPTSNATPVMGRTFMFVVDVDEIRSGEGMPAMRNIADYLGRLHAADRVGVVSLPFGTPRVDPTTDRQAVRRALEGITGASNRIRESEMTPGEASGIAHGDSRALLAYYERAQTACDRSEAPTKTRDEAKDIPPGCLNAARTALTHHQLHTRVMLDSLGALATAMAPLSGSKTLVLVSEGLLNDVDSKPDLDRFAAAAERARVTLYSLHLDAPIMEAATGTSNATRSRLLDDRVGFDGMADVAVAARGTAFRAIAQATPGLERIDRELSGYYLLSFERDLNDRDGQRQPIEVKVKRPGLDVRARQSFTLAAATTPPSAASPASLRSAMGELIHWPESVREIGLDVATYLTPVADDAARGRVLVIAEMAHGDRAPQAVGYEITDGKGQKVADTYDAPPTLVRLSDTSAMYAASVPLTSGRYQVRLGVIDAAGRRGSVEHMVDVRPWPPGGVRVSDLILGDASSGSFRPIARMTPTNAKVAIRIDIHADAAETLRDLGVTLRVEKAGATAPAVENIRIPLSSTSDSRRVVAMTEIDLSNLSTGTYVATAVIAGPSGEIARCVRRFDR